MLGRLAAAAHVAAPGLQARSKSPRIGLVERGRGRSSWVVVIQSIVLTAPEPVQHALLAHEVAHIARGHLPVRRRLKFGAAAAIMLVYFAFIGAVILEITTRNMWLWLVTVAAASVAMLTPRAVLLAVFRRQEFEADRVAVELLGRPEPVVALLDWITTNTKPKHSPLAVRLWMATHPSNAARRQAVVSRAREAPVHSMKGP
jgi:Zn-dependent protease with chaperone function